MAPRAFRGEGCDKLKVSDYIAEFLVAQEVKYVFEISGGMIMLLLDSLHRNGKIKVVTVHHEQAAGFAAEAIGRVTSVPGVAFATSGPGATNLLTAIGSCYFDSTPAVFITGQVNRHEMKGTRAIRQLGFQETDIVSMARPITKGAWQAMTPEDVPEMLSRAFTVCREGRPGPVLIDIPMDVQRQDVSAPVQQVAPPEPCGEVPGAILTELFEEIRTSRRPLILVGGGVRAARAEDLVRTLATRTQVPLVNSLHAMDVLPYDHPLRVGFIGTYGNRWANLALGSCDFLLVLGSRLDIRQTGSETAAFAANKKIFHVDCETGELNNRVVGCEAIVADLDLFLRKANEVAAAMSFETRAEWLAEIARLRGDWPDTKEIKDAPGINPNALIHELSAASGLAGAYTVDVGQHQMWAAQSVELRAGQRFLTSGGMGAMGFALPAAIGTALAMSPQPVVMVAGDGGFQVNIQELQTVRRNNLPIKMVIINNRCHGMTRQFQQTYFEGRYGSALWGYSVPAFDKVAEAYGIRGRAIEDAEDIGQAVKWLWERPDDPALLEVRINTFANAYPKIAFGKPISEMEPLSKPDAMEST
jgi:acetolactate synthase-1/2/3 large subunit